MDAGAQLRAMGMLGQFNDALTSVFDDAFGTRWAEIEDMSAIAAIVVAGSLTTRRLAEISGLDRRAVTRMLTRLREGGLTVTRPAAHDRRAVAIHLTDRGERQVATLRAEITAFFLASRELARQIADGLGAGPGQPPAAPADPLDLLARVCDAGVALVRVMPAATAAGALAARQRAALVQIAMTGGVRPNELATGLGVPPPTVSYIVDQLCAKGYARRRTGGVPGDRRAVILEATVDGQVAVQTVLVAIGRQREGLAALFGEIAGWRSTGIPPAPARRRSAAPAPNSAHSAAGHG